MDNIVIGLSLVNLIFTAIYGILNGFKFDKWLGHREELLERELNPELASTFGISSHVNNVRNNNNFEKI